MEALHVTLGLFATAAFALALALGFQRKPPLSRMGGLLLAAILLRIVGALIRHWVLMDFYGGSGDARVYHTSGVSIADYILHFDWSFLEDPPRGDSWFGTSFIHLISGVVSVLIGPSLRLEFVFFSLVAFIGPACLVIAYHRANAHSDASRYALFVFFLPSLWFWPSSVGKEAILLCGIGIAVLGYVGRRGRVSWIPLIVGIGLLAAIRPHVAVVVIASCAVAEWFGKRTWTVARLFQLLAVVAVFLVAMVRLADDFGLGDLSQTQEFWQWAGSQTQTGGSQIGSTSGWAAVPMAFVNILARPALYEAHNAMALASALEVTAVWGIGLYYRKAVWKSLKSWRSHRFLRMALPMSVAYVLMIGLTFSNLGIIARQRVLVLPFILAFLVGDMGRQGRQRSA